MKCASAIILLVVTVTTAEPPAPRGGYYTGPQSQQNNFAPQSAPYPGRGFRPNGPAFNLPQRQRNLPPAPAASYGPPVAEATTTEFPTTTEFVTEEMTTETQAQNLELQPKNEKLQANPNPASLGALYVLVPQSENLIYSAPVNSPSNAKLVATQPEVTSTRLIPIQAVPAFAKLVQQPAYAKVAYEQPAYAKVAVEQPAYAKVTLEQPAQLVYEPYQIAQATPVLAKVQEEPLLRYQTVAYASPDYSAAYVQRF